MNNEIFLKQDDFILSKTDLKGRIIYANKIFIDISAYPEDEILYKPHNIIRHPDMPKIAFKVAWDTIKNKKEFFGFIKNLRKDKKYYWVYTYITADIDKNNNIVSYTSVRRSPNRNAIPQIEKIYQLLIQEEQKRGMSGSQDFLQNFLSTNELTYNQLVFKLQKGEKIL